MGDIMSTVGDILSTVGCSVLWGYHDKCGGYLEYRGVFSNVGDIMSTMEGVQYRGGNLLLFEYPMVLNTPKVLMISPTCSMISPTVLKFQRMVSPTVLNTTTVFMMFPHGHHDIPHGVEHPHRTQDNPHGTHDIPYGTEHPTVLGTPHGTAHTFYRVVMKNKHLAALGVYCSYLRPLGVYLSHTV